MRRYETVVIMDAGLSEEERQPVIDRMTGSINDQNGLVIETDPWGSKKLAYEIKKKSRGYYLRLEYCGTGAVVEEMERFFRIDDRVLKYMTVLLEKHVDPARLKAELEAAAEAEAAATEQSEAAKAAEDIAEETAAETPAEPATSTSEDKE